MYPGGDEVLLRVYNRDKIATLRLSQIGVRYCPELHQKLVELSVAEGMVFEVDD
jgi:hypothetical protein